MSRLRIARIALAIVMLSGNATADAERNAQLQGQAYAMQLEMLGVIEPDQACIEAPTCAATFYYRRATKLDESFDFRAALELYDLVRTRYPSSRDAPQAEARAAELRAHSQGDFEPLKRLERVKRDPALASSREAIDALVRDAEGFPPGRVRIEAWSLAAEAYARRLGQPELALPLYERIVDEAKDDPVSVRHAAREAIAILTARGDFDRARDVARRAHDPKLQADVARVVRRRQLHLACIFVLVCAVAMAGAAWAAAARAGAIMRVLGAAKKIAPLALGYAAYVGGVGALLATSYEGGTMRPFVLFGVALGPVLLFARAWSAAGRATRGARAGRAAVCAAAALATAFLLLESVDVAYLEGLGL
jgi:tetratricopeptide (TPR) repeat protein